MNNKQALISVIVPCYNYGSFLQQCLNSILAQTYQNWECIIVDDGSTDNTAQVVTQLCEKDERISYVFQPHAGPAAARNSALKLAKGDFIQFLDADDLIEKQKFEKQITIFVGNSAYDIVYSNVKYFSSFEPSKLYHHINLDDSPPWMLKLSGKGDTMILPLLKGNIMVINSPLTRRRLFEKFGSFDESLFYNEDWELWLRFAWQNASFYFDNSINTQALVRVHTTSYSKDLFKMYIFGLKASLRAGKNANRWKYKRILVPKINYHKKILDRELIKYLSSTKGRAIEMATLVYKETGLARYMLYIKLFKHFPFWFCKLYTQLIFLVNKVKNTIIYA